MPLQSSYLSVEHYSAKQKRAVSRLLDMLAKGDHRLSDHYSQLRNHPRQRCHNLLHIGIPQPGGSQAMFSVFMRDISPGGTGFVYPGHLEVEQVLIGIPIPGKDDTWFRGNIVRSKQIIGEEFWDYGVKFSERLM